MKLYADSETGEAHFSFRGNETLEEFNFVAKKINEFMDEALIRTRPPMGLNPYDKTPEVFEQKRIPRNK